MHKDKGGNAHIKTMDTISKRLKNIYIVSNQPEITNRESINKYKYEFIKNGNLNELRNYDAKTLLFNLVEQGNLKLNTEIHFKDIRL